MSVKEFTETSYKRLQRALVCTENNLIESDGGMYLILNSLIGINNKKTGSNKITLTKINVKLYEFDRMYMDIE